MTCTKPTARFMPLDDSATRDYVFSCLDEAFRGLNFVQVDKAQREQLRRKLAKLIKEVENVIL